MNLGDRKLLSRCVSTLLIKKSRSQCLSTNSVASKSTDKARSYDEIPGPKPLPIIGNLWRYFPVIGEYSIDKLHRAYQKMYHQYGSIVKEKIAGQKTVVHLFDPDDIMKVYRNEGMYPQRMSHQALAKYRKDRPSVYKSGGLFPSNGEEWLRFRRLFQNILLNPSVAKSYYRTLEEVTTDLIAKIPFIIDHNNEVDLQPELLKWSLECVGAITLNRRLGCFDSKSNPDVQKLVESANKTHYSVFITESSPFFPHFETPSYKRLVAAQDYLATTVDKYIKEALSKDSDSCIKNSILHKMLNVPDADYKDVFTMVLDMFMAGIDTTAYTTAFGLYNLARNPGVQNKLRQELKNHLPKKDSMLSEITVTMPYLINFIKETLRLNPVAIGNGRVLVKDLVLSNYLVPAGTIVTLHHQALCLHESNFKDPLKLIPERWERQDKSKNLHHPFASTPFGVGPRSCVGRRFAQREMMFAFGKLVRNYEIEYHYEDIDSNMRLINVPDKPLKLRFLPIDS